MGFYGNITNTARTQFQFDRIYSNRYEMEISMSTDGVYAGRYVLIEYDQTPGGTEVYEELYLKNGKFYFGYEVSDTTRVRYPQDLALGEIVRVYTELPPVTPDAVDKRQPAFYKCTGGNNNNYATFEEITNSSIAQYTQNYSIDLAKYGDVGRGWDSTVWQKTYTNGVEKYVMIAELNTVVPTFDVVPDAPTLAPIAPHFDANSNNVYYQLHYQPQWGMRVRSADAKDSTNTNVVPSDENVTWKKYSYDVQSDIETVTESTEKGAIYYNKAGFDSKIITHDTATDNIISIEPTGVSGNKYNTHNGVSNDPAKPDKNEYAIAEDIQEITIMLPSIGNAIASLWDLIYGNIEQNNGTTRNHDISWETKMSPDRKGLRLVENGSNGFTYNTNKINTLAGCINSVHDLMGMIILNEQPTPNATTYNNNKIYYYNNKYWRIHKTYTYTKIAQSAFNVNGEYYYDVENGNFPRYGLWNNNVGYVDGLATRKVSYEMQELKGFSRDFNTIHGLLLEIRKILETQDTKTRDQSTVQGAINILNDIIAKFTDMTPTNVMIVDELGRAHGAPQTTKQLFAYVNEGYKDGTKNGAMAESEDRWIYWNVNDNAENPLITLEHRFTEIEDTTSTSDKNNDGVNGTGNNKAHGDTIDLYTPIVDNMGHIVGKNIETVTLPYGYKTFNTTGLNEENSKDIYTTIISDKNGANTSEASANPSNTIANNTQDTMNVNPGNKWIQTKFENDKLIIAHEIHAVNKVAKSSNLNTDNVKSELDSDKITIQDITFDKAGHVIENQPHTYTLPYGFKTIKTNGRGSSINENATNNPAKDNIIAENTQDTLNINSENRWIRIDTNGSTDTITFSHDIHKTSSSTSNATLSNEKSENVTFEVPTYSFDEAGHYISHDTKTLTMPFGYGKIEGDNNTSTSATATYDTLTFGSDEWLTATIEKDKVIYSHDYPKGSADTTSTSNVNGNGDTIVLETLTRDEKGHIVKVNQNTVTLPYGFKTIKSINSESVDEPDTTIQKNGQIADNTQDILNINTSNRWIKIDNSDEDTIKLGHAFAGEINKSANLAKDNNTTPKFGEKFKVFTAGIDEAGHVNNLSDYEITLPIALADKNSLAATGSSVITGIGTNDNGSITQTNANIGTLTLTDYNQGTDQGDLVASDSINSAFAKLQNQIQAEENARIQAIADEIKNRKAADDALAENLNKEITARESAVSSEAAARSKAIGAEQQARTQAISNAIAKEETDRNSAISTAIGNVTGGSKETIAALLTRIEALETNYNTLLTNYNNLLAKVEANHPTEEESIE